MSPRSLISRRSILSEMMKLRREELRPQRSARGVLLTIEVRKAVVSSSCHTDCTISRTSSLYIVPRPLMVNK